MQQGQAPYTIFLFPALHFQKLLRPWFPWTEIFFYWVRGQTKSTSRRKSFAIYFNLGTAKRLMIKFQTLPSKCVLLVNHFQNTDRIVFIKPRRPEKQFLTLTISFCCINSPNTEIWFLFKLLGGIVTLRNILPSWFFLVDLGYLLNFPVLLDGWKFESTTVPPNGFEPRSPGLVTQHPNYYPKAPYETKVTLPKNVHHGLYLLVKLKTCKSQLMLNADYTIYIFQNILRNSQKNILSNLVGLREFGELFYIMYKLAIAWA